MGKESVAKNFKAPPSAWCRRSRLGQGGGTPPHHASEGGVKVARLFVELGADASAQDNDGWTSLHRASSRGQVEVSRILIEHDAKMVSQNNEGWTPLHLASN
jgi:ankyrin repeat protein